jgi:hypothetical protein
VNKLAAAWRTRLLLHAKQCWLSNRLILALSVMIAVLLTIAMWAAWQLMVLYVEDSVHAADRTNGYQESPVAVLEQDVYVGHLSFPSPAYLQGYALASASSASRRPLFCNASGCSRNHLLTIFIACVRVSPSSGAHTTLASPTL